MRFSALLLLALCSGFAVSGCSTAAVGPIIATACAEYAKGKAAADALVAAGLLSPDAAAKIRSIEAFGDAACTSPPQGDPATTAVWLGQLVAELAAVAASA